MRYLLLGALALLTSVSLSAQNFQKTIFKSETDFNHYSVETSSFGDDYIFAGTQFTPDGQNVHVFRMDVNGNMLCEQTLNLSENDRALDFTEDHDGSIVVTGYTEMNGFPQVLIARFSEDCACESQTVLFGYEASAGTNIIESEDSYIVGGVRSDGFNFPLTNNSLLLLEFDYGLNLLNTKEYFDETMSDASVNDIVKLEEGYFVTGSVSGVDDNSSTNVQSAMALFVDNGFNVMDNLTFESTNNEHVGVSAVYNQDENSIYLMSNNSVIHNPQITVIENVNGGPSIAGNYYLELDPSYGQLNAAGFELRPSVFNPENLVAAGYFRTHDFGSAPYNNATSWVTEFQKGNGANVQTILNEAPSTNFHTHGGGVFSTFSGEHPYIFNQEILTERPDGKGYVFVGPRIVDGSFGLDIISTDFHIDLNSCLHSYNYESADIDFNHIEVAEGEPELEQEIFAADCGEDPSENAIFCEIGGGDPDPEPCIATSFARSFHQTGTDHNHYSIENLTECDYIIAGTEFKGGNNDIHIARVSNNGALIWEKFIDISHDDRALDVVVDPDGNIVVAGFAEDGYQKMYLIKMDANGNCIHDNLIGNMDVGAATNIIYSDAKDTYIVGGARSHPLMYPLNLSHAVVMEFDLSLNYTGNSIAVGGSDQEHASINDILEIPGGYFVTGSHDVGGTTGNGQQGVLAMFLDTGLGLSNSLSFESTNSEHVGVSAVYDESTDQIFLMSNNSVIHNPQITQIKNASTGPTISNHYYLELDPSYGQHNAAGFELQWSITNPNNLVAAGYFRTWSIGGITDNACPWLAEFDKLTGNNIQTAVYEAPSSNFHSHGGGFYSTFSGEHPYIFNQEIITTRADEHGYVFLSPREINGNYSVEMVSIEAVFNEFPCLTDYDCKPLSIQHDWITTNVINPGYSFTTPNAHCLNEKSKLLEYCDKAEKSQRTASVEESTSASLSVYPNPANHILTVEISNLLESGKIEITNALGEVILEITELEHKSVRVDLGSLNSGLYFITYKDQNERLTKKIMKQ